MSFSTTTPWVQYSGDDSTDEFAFNHKIYDESHVVVTLKVDATGVVTTQTITTHYTVADVADDAHDSTTPTITMVTPPATGETLTIYRDVPLTQLLTLLQTGAWYGLPLEKQIDLTTMIAQTIQLKLDRTAIGSLSSAATTTTLEELLVAAGIIPLSSLTAKTTAVDADLALLSDSADSFASKKITFANLLVYVLSNFVNTSAGAGDAGKGIKLDAGGHVDATMINDGDIDHTNIASIGTNTHAQIDTHLAASNPHSGSAPSASPTFTGTVTVPETAGVADYDKFVVLDSGVLKYRTGAEVLSDIGAGSGGFTFVYKSADEDLNNDTTLQDDDELGFAVAANSEYTFTSTIIWSADATPDMKWGVSYPTGTDILWSNSGGAGATMLAETDTAVENGGFKLSILHGKISTSSTAGNFYIQWAQNSSNAAINRVYKGSCLRYADTT